MLLLCTLAALLFLLPGTASAQCDVPCFVADMETDGTNPVLVPVYSAVNLAQFEIEAFHMEFDFCADHNLDPFDIETSGTMIDGYGIEAHNIQDQHVEISWAGGTDFLPDSPLPLFYIVASNHMTQCEDECIVQFTVCEMESQQNGGGYVDSCPYDGTITYQHITGVEGYVFYINGDPVPLAVPDALIEDATHNLDQFTDANGHYKFYLCEESGLYCFTPSKDTPPQQDDINGDDAALILRYTVGLTQLSQWYDDYCPPTFIYPQRVAADVTCDGSITPLDASKILRFWLNQNDIHDCVGQWRFFCTQECVTVHVGDYNVPVDNFWTLQMGDVNLSWDAAPLRGREAGHRDAQPVVFRAPTGPVNTGEENVLDFTLESDVQAYSASVDFIYDQRHMTLTDVELGDAVESGMVMFSDENGVVRIVMATANEFIADGSLFKLHFDVDLLHSNDRMLIDVTDGTLGDVDIIPVLEDGTIQFNGNNLMAGPMLGANKPNPFNPRTTITLSLSEEGPVLLEVYGVDGRLVRTLVDGFMPAAAHEVVWDGRNGDGAPVSSGIYWTVLRASGVTAKRPMILLK